MAGCSAGLTMLKPGHRSPTFLWNSTILMLTAQVDPATPHPPIPHRAPPPPPNCSNAANALSEDNSLLQVPVWRNPWLLVAMAVSLGLHAVILYVPFLADVFSIVPLSLNEWLLVLAYSLPVILLEEVTGRGGAGGRGRARWGRGRPDGGEGEPAGQGARQPGERSPLQIPFQMWIDVMRSMRATPGLGQHDHLGWVSGSHACLDTHSARSTPLPSAGAQIYWAQRGQPPSGTAWQAQGGVAACAGRPMRGRLYAAPN